MYFFAHNIKIAKRNILTDIKHFALNIFGLILGISCFVTIMIYVYHESSYDKFHLNHENLYRITTHLKRGTEDTKWAITNGGLVPLLKEQVPEVRDATKAMIEYTDQTFTIDDQTILINKRKGFHVDPNFLEVFQFVLVSGDRGTLLKEPNSIVVSESLALKIFGTSDANGKTIIQEGLDDDSDVYLKVTGVFLDIPQNSHIQFDYLVSGTGEYWDNLEDPKMGGYPVYVYFLIHDNIDANQLRVNIDSATQDIYPETIQFPIQKVTDIYFNAENLFEQGKTGNISFTRSLVSIAFFILVISIINNVLLNASKSIKRIKEIGIRKIVGASRLSLIKQFLVESILLSLLAGLISILVVETLFELAFSMWFSVSLSLLDHYLYIPLILLLSVFSGILSGFLPAFKISRFRITDFFKGNILHFHSSKINFRSILVTIQFIFATVIVISSVVVIRQLNYLKSKDLGFNKELVVNIPRAQNIDDSSWSFFKESLKNESMFEEVGSSLYQFIDDYNTTSIRIAAADNPDTVALRVQWNSIDHNLIPTMKMNIVEGRNFSEDIGSDTLTLILNETGRKELGMSDLLGKDVLCWFFGESPGKIIGIVNDFHFSSFDTKITPTVFILNKGYGWDQNLLVRLNSSNYQEAILKLKDRWDESEIASPFTYSFLDEWFANLIQKEKRLSDMVTVFSAITILISVIGLIGLISYSLERKVKEIGIRKVFGAGVRNILIMINSHFLKYVLLGLILATPIAIWGTNRWLQSFAYRIKLNVFDFILSAVLFLFITALVISIKSWKSANTNPALTLKDE